MGERWPSGLERWFALAIALRTTSLRNFDNSVYPALPVSFGGDIKKSSVASIWCLCQGK